jgi:coproporphyrinogen III oxidase
MQELKTDFTNLVELLQTQIIDQMKVFDPEMDVIRDDWKRLDFKGNDGGGGKTRVMTGKIFENAGVNTSQVYGEIDPNFAKALGNDKSNQLWASGISLIIHPRNPRVPTVHANFRMIILGEKLWFGGGADLTPFYPHEEDFAYFHGVWKKALSPYGLYEKFKKNCDEYFVNFHRDNEMRGIGGFFFDHFSLSDGQKDLNFIKEVSSFFIESYFPIVEKRFKEEYTQDDEEFMLHRHGRYVEFNLLHDRGTLFGLKTNGRTDSIFVSLPARCKFTYKYAPKAESPHAKMMEYYRPYNWLG